MHCIAQLDFEKEGESKLKFFEQYSRAVEGKNGSSLKQTIGRQLRTTIENYIKQNNIDTSATRTEYLCRVQTFKKLLFFKNGNESKLDFDSIDINGEIKTLQYPE